MTSSKHCSACGKRKSRTAFWKDARRGDGLRGRCVDCDKSANRKYYQRNPLARIASTMKWRSKNMEKHKAQTAKGRARIKRKLMDGYGGKCVCCGEAAIEFLTLEHINGGGRAHRAIGGSMGVYREVIRQNFPPNYTVLCMNCNYAKRYGRACPHEVVRAILAKVRA